MSRISGFVSLSWRRFLKFMKFSIASIASCFSCFVTFIMWAPLFVTGLFQCLYYILFFSSCQMFLRNFMMRFV